MSLLKKVVTALVITALMVPAVAVNAAGVNSVTKTKIADANVTVSGTSVSYTGKAQSPQVAVSVDGKTLVQGTDYTLTVTSATNAGTYHITVVVTGIGHYEGTVNKTVNFTIAKAKQPVKNAPAKKLKVKAKKLKKKAVKIKLKVKAKGKKKYKSKSKRLKVN